MNPPPERPRRARVIVASQRAAAGVYPDSSGPLLVAGLRELGLAADRVVVPDGAPVAEALRAALRDGVDLVITSGGTGVSPTDRTPEVTAPLLTYQIPGIAEAVRAHGARAVPTAALSRGLAGVAGRTLVVNVAGSTGAARDALVALGPLLPHALAQLRGDDHPTSPGNSAATPPAAASGPATTAPSAPTSWEQARGRAHAAGRAAPLAAVDVALAAADGSTLAADLTALTPLPAFDTASVDGYALRGAGPWRVAGRVLAGARPAPLADDGTAAEIATGAMLPPGTDAVLRTEEAAVAGGVVTGTPRPADAAVPEWRPAGAEAPAGAPLAPAGTSVTPALLGLAAAAGHDVLPVRRAPRVAVRVFGDELRTAGTAADGRLRDALGPALPALLRRWGAEVEVPPPPIADTLDAHVAALREALAAADVVCTTGGTMRGPADHLHAALAALGATYLVDTVAVRPGYPMLLARVGDRHVVGLPGNPQSAVIAALTLAVPLVAGLTGRDLPGLATVRLADALPRRGGDTHLALVRLTADGAAPVPHGGSAMLRGLALADGYAVVLPGAAAETGAAVPFLPVHPAPVLPLYPAPAHRPAAAGPLSAATDRAATPVAAARSGMEGPDGTPVVVPGTADGASQAAIGASRTAVDVDAVGVGVSAAGVDRTAVPNDGAVVGVDGAVVAVDEAVVAVDGAAVGVDGAVVVAEVTAVAWDAADHEAAVRRPAAGAVAAFHGVVRDHDHGRDVTALTYEAHPDAGAVLAAIAAEIAADPAVHAVAVRHRVGALAVGDLALSAAVSTAHRAAAFAACARLVALVKERVPVWKHQRFADGTAEWVNCA